MIFPDMKKLMKGSVLVLFFLLFLPVVHQDQVYPQGTKKSSMASASSPIHNQSKTWLALGDSYTIGESVPPAENFPSQTIARLNAAGLSFNKPEIIAVTGWTTRDLIDAIATKKPARDFDFVSLLIGVNNQYQGKPVDEFKKEFDFLLKQAIQFAGQNPNAVFVLSIPDYSVTPFAVDRDRKTIAREIDLMNEIIRESCNAHQVAFLDITPESKKAAGDPSLLAPDGLHFSGKEYSIWAERLAGLVKDSMH